MAEENSEEGEGGEEDSDNMSIPMVISSAGSYDAFSFF